VREGSGDAVGSGVAPPLLESEAAAEVEREGGGEGAPDAVGDDRREAAGEGEALGGAVFVGVPRGEGEGVWRPLADGVPLAVREREAPPLPVGDSFGEAEGELSLLPAWAAVPDGSAVGLPVPLVEALEVALTRKALGVPLPPAAVGVGGAEGDEMGDAEPLAVPTQVLEALPPPSKEGDSGAVALTPVAVAPKESVASGVGVPLLQAEGVGESVPPAPRAVDVPRLGDPLALCDGCAVRVAQREGAPDALPAPLAEVLPEALSVALPPKKEGEGAAGVAEGHCEGATEALPFTLLAVAAPLPVAASLALRLALRVASPLPLRAAEPVTPPLRDALPLADAQPLPLAAALRLRLPRGEGEGFALFVTDGEGGGETEAEGLCEGGAVSIAEGVTEAEAEGRRTVGEGGSDAQGDALAVPLAEALRAGDTEAEEGGVGVAVARALPVAPPTCRPGVGVAPPLGEALERGEPLPLAQRLALEDAEALPLARRLAAPVGEGAGERESEASSLGEALPLGERHALPLTRGEGVPDGLPEVNAEGAAGALRLWGGEREGGGGAVGGAEGVLPSRDAEAAPVGVPRIVGEGELLREPPPPPLTDGTTLVLPLTLLQPLVEGEPLPRLPVAEGDAEAEGEDEGEREGGGEAEMRGEGDTLPLPRMLREADAAQEGLVEPLGEREAGGEALILGSAEGAPSAEALPRGGLGVACGETDTDLLTLSKALSEALPLGEGVPPALPEGEGGSDAVNRAEGDAVAVAEPPEGAPAALPVPAAVGDRDEGGEGDASADVEGAPEAGPEAVGEDESVGAAEALPCAAEGEGGAVGVA
jgi:hypothetical protein